ncbi:hypothetical protein ACF0H5_017575 [Mactra antiquata]
MKGTFVLFALAISAVSAFTPTVTVDCVVGPSYTFTLSGGSSTGVIFIDGECEAQATATTGTYTFNSTECTTGTVPALGTNFLVVVQEYSAFNLQTDAIINVTCSLNTTSVNETITATATGETFGSSDTGYVSPTFTVALQNSSDSTLITAGAVGDPAQISITIPSSEAAVFDFQVTTLSVAAGASSVTMLSGGCTQYSSIITQPSAQSAGVLTIGFNLFIPLDTLTSPSLPGTAATTVTFSIQIEVCDTACVAPTCSSRKRRSSESNSTILEHTDISTSLVVYPAGSIIPSRKFVSASEEQVVVEDVHVCLSRTPLIGMLVGMSIALVICLALSGWMFCRMRRPNYKGSEAAFSNASYQH